MPMSPFVLPLFHHHQETRNTANWNFVLLYDNFNIPIRSDTQGLEELLGSLVMLENSESILFVHTHIIYGLATPNIPQQVDEQALGYINLHTFDTK